MEALVKLLQADYPELTFVSGPLASWSPVRQQITYTSGGQQSAWTLLHEVAHGLLGHTAYDSDLQLLQKEAAAWAKAKDIARRYQIIIDNDHIQDCLDTYRNWLHHRSLCPFCGRHGLQSTPTLYSCLNCRNGWKVSSRRFCRPYRLKKLQNPK